MASRGWWEAVQAGESITIAATATGPGGFGVLVGPERGKWTINRGFNSGTLYVHTPPAASAGLWWIQLATYSGTAKVEATVRAGTAGLTLAPVALTHTLTSLPAGEIRNRTTILPPAPPEPSREPWSVSEARIWGEASEPFIPVGSNIGVNYSIGGNVWGDESTTPHATEAAEWGWNTVRINCYVSTETSWIKTHGLEKTYAQTFKAAQNYLDAGFAVILAPMDVTAPISGSSEPRLTHIEDFARAAGERFKDEPRAWFNVNEPSRVTGETFVPFHQRFIDAWRSAGHKNIYIADVLTNAQDPTWGTEPKIHSGPGQALNEANENVVYGLHIYGGQAQDYDTQETFNARYTSYLQKCQAAGLAMLIGETGYRVDGRDQAGANPGAFNRNQRGYRAALVAGPATGVGVLAWHGTFDLFTLKKSLQSSGYHGRPFYYPTAGGDLSPMGQEFWVHCHPGV